jgi:hypothetical protein
MTSVMPELTSTQSELFFTTWYTATNHMMNEPCVDINLEDVEST